MQVLVLAACLLAQPGTPQRAFPTGPGAEREGEAPAASGAAGPLEYLRTHYLADAQKCEFHADEAREHALKLVEKPVMRWSNDDDWSGDVFVWTHGGLPGVIGCILSGPSGEASRLAFHEFHLLADPPLAPAQLQTRRNWQPEGGLSRIALEGAPPPADTAAGRLAQMREIARGFTAHMDADGMWELRLLTQPLFRYGDDETAKRGVIDGALFTWVWTKGTDPEVILLVECRQTEAGQAWHYAPVRFSNRSIWLKRGDKEVWRAPSHNEPTDGVTTLIYTTAYARTFPREPMPNE